MSSRPLVVALGLCLFNLVLPHTALAQSDVVIGASGNAPLHQGLGRAICRIYSRSVIGGSCEILPIAGGDAEDALAVLARVRNGAIEAGLVPSDWQYFGFTGSGPVEFMDVDFDNLRALFSLHGEPFTLVARRDAGIDSLSDLPGKRVNIGTPGSAERAMMTLVMRAMGWNRGSFALADELTVAEQFLALCQGRVQAVVINTSHPHPAVAQAVKLCDARPVDVTGAGVDKLIADHAYLSSTRIAAGTYPGSAAVTTFGVKITAVSSTSIDDDTAYEIVSAVFGNLERIQRLHQGLRDLTPAGMHRDGLTAPLHPGAERYFRAAGLM